MKKLAVLLLVGAMAFSYSGLKKVVIEESKNGLTIKNLAFDSDTPLIYKHN